jgi:hypothetical protein
MSVSELIVVIQSVRLNVAIGSRLCENSEADIMRLSFREAMK